MSEFEEPVLESLVQKLRTVIEEKVATLNPTEISAMSSKIPETMTMLEYRDLREKFQNQFKQPIQIPQPVSYSDELFKRPFKNNDLDSDNRKSLKDFFKSEIQRVNKISSIVNRRYKSQDRGLESHLGYSAFMDSIARHKFVCEEGLLRLSARTLITFTADDLYLEMSGNINRKKRNAMLKSFLTQISKFPLTSRQQIYKTFFDDVKESLQRDTAQRGVPVLIRENAALNAELKRLAARFDLNDDLAANDGQQFLYYSDKAFDELWPLINTFELPRKSTHMPETKAHPTVSDLTQKALIKQLPRDMKLIQLMDGFISLRDDEVNLNMREISQFYNTTVGIQIRGQMMTLNEQLLPGHHLIAWFKLRFLHSKFMSCSLLSHLNYFEYVKQCLSGTEKVRFRYGHSTHFNELLEIRGDSGPFIYQSAMQEYNDTIDQMIAIGSYYIQKFEASTDGTKIVDREAILEQLLNYELRFINAKRSIVQTLLEIYGHCEDESIKQQIFNVMAERPHVNPSLYHSYDGPYKLAVDLIERKARLMRTLTMLQVEHERHIGVQSSSKVPLFDRPVIMKIDEATTRMFNESMFATPFEVYDSLKVIGRFQCVIQEVSREFTESADIRSSKFGDYMENTIWKHLEQLLNKAIQTGLFPFDRASFNFKFLLSDSVNSLFTSSFVNSIDSFTDMLSKMNQSRQLRFIMAMRRFVNFTWKLQKLMIETNVLQSAYFDQCDRLGVSERSVLLSAFRDPSKKEGFDVQSAPTNDKIIDFALTEFEAIVMNFSSQVNVKDIISTPKKLDKLNDLIRFQELQNAILEACVRYNSMIMDSDFFVSYFALGEQKEDVDVFLTSTPAEEGEPEDDQLAFFKQFMAAQVFYQSMALFRDNESAKEDKTQFTAPIKAIKIKTRAIIAGQIKNKEREDDVQLIDVYMSEMINSFSPISYRVEIARICTLERQILMCNSYIDTYVMGPDESATLINEAGRFEMFFYVPTWVECVKMMQTAPWQQQSVILKSLVGFLIARYQTLSLARFECSLQTRSSAVFERIYDQTFIMETPIFQKLFNEFGRMNNGREADISMNYFQQKVQFAFLRFEYSVLKAFEGFFLSLNIENKKSSGSEDDSGTRQRLTSGISDPKFGGIMKDLWMDLHAPLAREKRLITVRRYIPLWQDEFIWPCIESDRMELMQIFSATDEYMETASASFRNNIYMDIFALLPPMASFMSSAVALFYMKFAFFLLMSRVDENKITAESTVMLMTQPIFVEYYQIWNEVIVKKAVDQVTPKPEESYHMFGDTTVSEVKLLQAITEIARQNLDNIVLGNQIKNLQSIIHKFTVDVSQCRERNVNAIRPGFLSDSTILNNRTDTIFIIHPNDADAQFGQENKYAHAKLLNMVYNALDECTLERRDHDGTFSTIFSGDGFEENCMKLSTAFNVFWDGSLSDLNFSWKQYITTTRSEIMKNEEAMNALRRKGSYTYSLFERHKDAEKASQYQDQILMLNALQDEFRRLVKTHEETEIEMEKDVRNEYDQLVSDLKHHVAIRKSQFREIKNSVYDAVNKKIDAAKQVKLEVSKKSARRMSVLDARNEHIFENIEAENQELRRQVVKMRIIRCLSDIANTRFYKKKLNTAESDRCSANALLWSNKLQYESQEEAREKQLAETHKRLSDTEIEIERLKQQLDNEKLANSQLVHWKAKNLKTVENLKAEIAQIRNVSDVNIDDLLEKMRVKQEELDELRKEGEELDKKTEEFIRRPMRQVDKIRTQVMQTRVVKSSLVETMKSLEDEDEVVARSQHAAVLISENAQMRKTNELLKRQIEELESIKDRKATDVRTYMENTVQPPPPSIRSAMKAPGIIIKPKMIHGAARSHSRI